MAVADGFGALKIVLWSRTWTKIAHLDFVVVSRATDLSWCCFQVQTVQFCQLDYIGHGAADYLAVFRGFAALEVDIFWILRSTFWVICRIGRDSDSCSQHLVVCTLCRVPSCCNEWITSVGLAAA